MMDNDSGRRASAEPALVASLPEPVSAVSAHSGDGQAQWRLVTSAGLPAPRGSEAWLRAVQGIRADIERLWKYPEGHTFVGEEHADVIAHCRARKHLEDWCGEIMLGLLDVIDRDRRLKPLVETGTGSIACDESPGSASAEIASPSPPTGDDNV